MEYKYKFSVVMAVYNVEQYLEESILSVVNQNIGFKENVQLILINDGSLDDSEKICLKYKKLYPNNIVYVKKENGGVSSARNLGLQYVEGQYVNFMDSDDTISLNTLKEVNNFFERSSLVIDSVAIPLRFFGSQTGLHAKYNYMGKTNRIISLDLEPWNFILTTSGSFYKSVLFKNLKFNEKLKYEEDGELNGKLYLKNSRFGYVCENNVQYNYRKRETNNSASDVSKVDKKSYYAPIEMLSSIINRKDIKDYQKELIIYELRSRFKNIYPEIFDSETEYNEIINQYSELVSLIDKKWIIGKSRFCNTRPLKKMFLQLANYQLNDSEVYSTFIHDLPVIIQRVSFEKNIINIDVTYSNYGYNNYEVVAYDDKNNIYSSIDSDSFSSPYDPKVGTFYKVDTQIAKFSFDMSKTRVIKFILYDTLNDQYIALGKHTVNGRISLASAVREIETDGYLIKFNGRKFKIRRASSKPIKRLYRSLRRIIAICVKRKFIALDRIFSRKIKKYILINDRDIKAGDNGEALFKYINENRKDIAKYTYYVISKKSNDYRRLKKKGKVVSLKSFKHKYLFLNCKMIYSSHTMLEYFSAFDKEKMLYYKDLLDYKFVWLQHGITQNDISLSSNKYVKNIDKVITATEMEKVEFLKKKYFYDDEDVLLTGFAKDDSKNIITIAPTWRRGFGVSEPRRDDFEFTKYYENYKNILTNEKLLNLAKKNNYKIQFILHPEMSHYLNSFKKLENESVVVKNASDIEYSNVFKESKLFITDYSSTYFDFAYLKKPLIYFQFDQVEFYHNHYDKGYFEFERDGFGDVLENIEDLVKKIEFYFKNDFAMDKKYLKRVENTFRYTDDKNCERIINSTYEG